jgi:signal transduction histidine kinase
MNLLANAIKYARRGGRVRVASCSADGARVEVRVEDDGPGVAPEDRERIFEPYVRAGEGRRAGGLGLGLAICKRIVEAHGGTIGVSDRPGGGSVFAFSLPTARPGAA